MRKRTSLLGVLLSFLAGFMVQIGTADSDRVRRAGYEAGFESGVCKPLLYEDGSFVLEDGNGQLCVKP